VPKLSVDRPPASRQASRPHVVDLATWPFVVGTSLGIYWIATEAGQLSPDLAVLAQFTYLVGLIYALEQIRPYHPEWNVYDGQLKNDLIYNITFPAAQLLATVVSLYLLRVLAGDQQEPPWPAWPAHWPLLAQLLILVPLLDLVFYSVHRAFHSSPRLWRVHSIHHSSLQLHIVNNARLHPFEVAATFAPVVLLVHLIGVPLEVFGYFLAFQQAVGLMTHGNVRVRTGRLGLLLNTPEQHHWHHSRLPEEGNRNFGSVTMIWDHVFRSFLRPASRLASPDIGTDTPVPDGFAAQMIAPLQRPSR